MRRTFTIVLATVLMLGLGGCASSGSGGNRRSKAGKGASETGNPLYAFTVMRRGSALLQQGQYEDALKAFRKASALQPGNSTIYNMTGLCLLKLERFPEAVKEFDHALDLVPAFSDARNNRGAAYLAMGQYNLAEVDFLAVLSDSIYPHRWDVYYNLGMTYLQQGQLLAAEENLRHAAFAPMPVKEAYLRLAEIQEQEGKLDGALDTLEDAHLKFPDRQDIGLRLGQLLVRTGRTDEGKKYLLNVIRADPNSKAAAEARRALGEK